MSKIVEFMKLCLLDTSVPLSWGISNIEIGKDFMCFYVHGSKLQCQVIIIEKHSKLIAYINGSEMYFTDVIKFINWLDNIIE